MHTIRLRGPWELHDSSPHGRRPVTLPMTVAQFSLMIAEYPVNLVRNFHRPTGLTEEDVVELHVRSPLRLTEIRLNDQVLENLQIPQNVLEWLRDRNALSVTLERPKGLEQSPGQEFGPSEVSNRSILDAYLAIRETRRA